MAHPYIFASNWDKFRIALGIFISLAECVVDPISTIIIGKIFKDVENVGKGQLTFTEFMSSTETFCFVLVGLTFYSAIVNTLGYMTWVTTGYSIGHKLRMQMYKVIALNPPAWFDEKSNLSGTAMMYFKDIQDIEVAAGVTSYEIAAMGIGCLVQIGVAFYYSWAVTLICLAGIPVLIFICSLFSPLITKYILKSKSQQEKSSEKINWILRAFDTVKIFQRSKFEWKQFHDKIREQKDINIKYWAFFHLQEGLCRSIVLLVFVQGFYFGSYMVRSHGLSAGNVVTVFWSCLNASGLLQTVIGHFIEWNKGKASAERLLPVFSLNEEEIFVNSIGLYPGQISEKLNQLGWNSPSTTSFSTYAESVKDLASYSGHIEFTDVIFSYPSRSELVLTGLNMEFQSQQTTFVLGRSGSGKSTIAALLTKQYPWQAGEITVDGHGVDFLSKNWIERNVYVCEQMPKLFDIPLIENIRIGSLDPESVSDQDIKQALADSCADFVWDLPDQLETSGSYPLSGGQAQRISLARARIRNAPIVIYDESTSALDPALQKLVYQQILRYREGKTTIVITHNPKVIPNGFPIYIMDNGAAQKYNNIMDAMNESTYLNLDMISTTSDSLYADEKPTNNLIAGQTEQLDKPIKLEYSEQLMLTWELLKSVNMRSVLLLGYFVTSIHAAINPIFSFLFSKLVMGILDPNAPKVTMWAMLVLMCAFLDGIVSAGKILLNIAAEGWQLDIRDRIVDKILDFKGSKIGHEYVSYYSKLLVNDTEKCCEVLTLYLPALLSMFILGLVGFIWALVVSWKLTLVGISLVPVFVTINQLYKHLYAKWTGVRETKRADVIRLMMDLTSTSGYRTMKVQHLEHYFGNFYMQREQSLNKVTKPMILQVGSGYGVLKCFPYALESLLLWYGMHLIGKLAYSTQSVVTVFTLLMFTIVTIDQLTSSIGSIGPGFEALPRLLAAFKGRSPLTCILPEQPKLEVEKPFWSTISFTNVGIEFSNGQRILGNFCGEMSSGEIIALVGPSGIGKSTIGRILEKLEPRYSGSILVDEDIEFSGVSTNDVRRDVCMVSQMPVDFFDGTIKENLSYALDENEVVDQSLLDESCLLSGASNFISNLKDGYDTYLNNGGQLSGGQLQRLGIARALMRQPKVLILDECTSALDHESKQVILESLNRIRQTKNIIIIMITHQMDVARYADKVIKL